MVVDGLFSPNGIMLVGNRLLIASTIRNEISELNIIDKKVKIFAKAPGLPDNIHVSCMKE